MSVTDEIDTAVGLLEGEDVLTVSAGIGAEDDDKADDDDDDEEENIRWCCFCEEGGRSEVQWKQVCVAINGDCFEELFGSLGKVVVMIVIVLGILDIAVADEVEEEKEDDEEFLLPIALLLRCRQSFGRWSISPPCPLWCATMAQVAVVQ